MDRHNLKSLSLTHILGRSYKLWLKKKRMKKRSLEFHLHVAVSISVVCLNPQHMYNWTCETAENHVADVCNWKISWEYGRTDMGKLLVENKAELNLQSLAAQWNADSNQTENCTQSVLHMSFSRRVVIWWPFSPLHFCVAAHNVFSSVPCWETSFGTLKIPS